MKHQTATSVAVLEQRKHRRKFDRTPVNEGQLRIMPTPDSTILVADDMTAVVRTVSSMLRVLGYDHVLTARDGREASEILHNQDNIGLIICDWSMPRLNGIELLKHVRLRPQWTGLPFLMLAGKLDPPERSLLEDLDASGYLIKPIHFDHLQAAMHSLRADDGKAALHQTLARIRRHLDNEDQATAEHELRAAHDKLPQSRTRLQIELAGIRLMQGRLEQAQAAMEGVLAEKPESSLGRWVMARVHCARDDFEQGLQAINEAVQLSPLNAEYQFLAGKLHLHLGQPSKAKRAFHRSLNTDSNNAELKERIWNVYLEQGLVDRVEQDFGPFLFNHLGVETLNRQGMTLRKQNRLEEAIGLYQRALKLHPESQHLLYNLAIALVNQNQIAKAKKKLERALDLDPHFAQAQHLLNKLAFLHEEER